MSEKEERVCVNDGARRMGERGDGGKREKGRGERVGTGASRGRGERRTETPRKVIAHTWIGNGTVTKGEEEFARPT